MKCSSTPMKFSVFSNANATAVLLTLFVAAGCGGRDSTASKSAAEFDRAQAKGGTPATTGGAHGGHGGDQQPQSGSADSKSSADMAGDHSNMPGMTPGGGARTQGGATAGMDHSNMPGTKPAGGTATQGGAMAGMDHSNMPGIKPAGGARTQGGSMAGMDHSNMPGMAMRPPVPEKPSVSAEPGQPAATLRRGDLDSPAPTSLRDAARATAMAQEMAGGHGAMAHGTYSQVDAGRDDVPITSPTGKDRGGSASPPDSPAPTGHEGHGAAATPAPPTASDPHAGHRMPVPRPTPSPSPAPKENE